MSSNSWALGERSLAYDPNLPVSGPDVSQLQHSLVVLGYSLSNDGIYGPATAEQVRHFQDHRRLTVDGIFGPPTMRELSRVVELVSRPNRPYYLRDRSS